ncbi:MAG: hypothetical protein WCE80_02340 [Acidimicrobiia bacterium]
MDVAIDILRVPLAAPQLRSNTLRLIAATLGLTINEETPNSTTFSVDYTDEGIATRTTFTLDSDGYLLAEETISLDANPTFGIPANTVTFTAIYSKPQLVDNLYSP